MLSILSKDEIGTSSQFWPPIMATGDFSFYSERFCYLNLKRTTYCFVCMLYVFTVVVIDKLKSDFGHWTPLDFCFYFESVAPSMASNDDAFSILDTSIIMDASTSAEGSGNHYINISRSRSCVCNWPDCRDLQKFFADRHNEGHDDIRAGFAKKLHLNLSEKMREKTLKKITKYKKIVVKSLGIEETRSNNWGKDLSTLECTVHGQQKIT